MSACDCALEGNSIKVTIGGKTVEVCCEECAQTLKEAAAGLLHIGRAKTMGAMIPSTMAGASLKIPPAHPAFEEVPVAWFVHWRTVEQLYLASSIGRLYRTFGAASPLTCWPMANTEIAPIRCVRYSQCVMLRESSTLEN